MKDPIQYLRNKKNISKEELCNIKDKDHYIEFVKKNMLRDLADYIYENLKDMPMEFKQTKDSKKDCFIEFEMIAIDRWRLNQLLRIEEEFKSRCMLKE